MPLPEDMLQGASLENEEGWRKGAFLGVLMKAESHNLACLGGQYQFRFDDGTCEMYWLCADANERREDQTWSEFVASSNDQVRSRFIKLCETADIDKEIEDWDFVRKKKQQGVDPMEYLWFVASFVTEEEFNEL